MVPSGTLGAKIADIPASSAGLNPNVGGGWPAGPTSKEAKQSCEKALIGQKQEQTREQNRRNQIAENAKRTMGPPAESMSDNAITFPLGGPTVGPNMGEYVPMGSIPAFLTPLVQEWYNAGFVWPNRNQIQVYINELNGNNILSQPLKEIPCPWPRQPS